MATEMAKKMFGNSPKMEREEKSGKMGVKRSGKVDEENDEAEDQGDGESMPIARHAMERMDMHHKHEREHHTHDMAKHGSKKEMHKRHIDEHESMMKRHEKEHGGEKK